MSDKTKEIIIKTVIVLGCILGALILIIPFFAFFCESPSEADPNALPQPIVHWWNANFVAFIANGILLMILLPVFGLNRKPVRAERFSLEYQNFPELKEQFITACSKQNYQIHEPFPIDEQSNLLMFTKKKTPLELDCIAVFRVPALNAEFLELVNDKITEFLTAYYGKTQITDTVNMIAFFCVDRVTPPFQKLVNSNMQQGFKNTRLAAGFSFGGKTLYIARQKDGFALRRYKRMRKMLLNIMGIDSK